MTRQRTFDWEGVEYASPEYYRRWRLANNEKSREYHRAYDKKQWKEKYAREKARRERYIAKYPYRARANKILTQAIKNKRIVRQPCEICGEKAIAHHDYYGHPLDVIWLCDIHHKARHTYLKSIGHNLEPTEEDKVLLMTKHYRWR